MLIIVAYISSAIDLITSFNGIYSEMNQNEQYKNGNFHTIRSVILKIGGRKSLKLRDINKQINELLRKVIAEQVHIYQRTNLVKSQKYSNLLNSAMKSYLNGILTNEEVIE